MMGPTPGASIWFQRLIVLVLSPRGDELYNGDVSQQGDREMAVDQPGEPS